MKSLSFTPPYSDEAIVAWLDGEMSDADARRFEAALKSDGELAARTAGLMSSNQNYRQAFAPLLDEAPLERMQARLEAQLAKADDSRAPAPRPSFSRRSMIAASLSFLLIGGGFGYLARPAEHEPDENENIRDLEARYMSLYSTETLLDLDSSPPLLQRGLARTAEDLGLHLNAHQLRLQGAELKMVRMLRYDSTSIAQIAWMHVEYGPMALCISPLRQPGSAEISREQRHGMNLAWWRDRGYQFVLIGRNPDAQLQNSARTLQAALS